MNGKIISISFVSCHRKIRRAVLIAAVALSAIALPVLAQEGHHAMQAASPPGAFVVSTTKPFSALMGDAMAVMDDGMRRAPMNGVTEHDFVTMMIPHHQGAIDMAKALLLYTQDPELKNLAQGIITDQQNEIRVMQAWLRRYQTQHSGDAPPLK